MAAEVMVLMRLVAVTFQRLPLPVSCMLHAPSSGGGAEGAFAASSESERESIGAS